MKRIARIFIATAAGVEFPAREAALACAVCGLDAEPGFLWSMGFLIAMPFAIAAIAGGCFLYGAKRGKGSAGEERDFT